MTMSAPPRRTEAEVRRAAGWVVATVLLCLSFTPSLLPRTWLTQGLLSGITAATGYGLGCAVAVLAGRRRPGPGRRLSAYAWIAVPLIALSLSQGWRWQWRLGEAMGVHPPSAASWLAVLPVAAATGGILIRGARLLARIGRFVRGHRPLRTAAVALTVAAALGQGVIAGTSLDLADRVAAGLDGPAPGMRAPDDPARSGSAASLVSWSSLDKHGRTFVTGGAGTAGPIRVYVGLRSAPDPASRARLAVAELKRTGAFTRRVLCVVVPTGSGWVDEPTVGALEQQSGGDTALVAVQYAAVPSWLSFLAGSERARAAAAALLTEVHRHWSALPAGSRPRLLVYGNSLGALAAQAPFGDLAALLGQVDGALLTGPPNDSGLWRAAVAGRDRGTTEAAPRLAGDPGVRFAGLPADLDCSGMPGGPPRVLFLQHPTDPVVWWSPRLILRRPDWLREPRSPGVLPAVRWYPVVTFWQLSADMLAALGVPAGYGHRYSAEAPAAWAQLIAPPGGGCGAQRAS